MRKFLLIALALVLALGMSATAFAAPSNWAVADVNRAVELGLVIEALQSDYQNPITRAEFCSLIMTLVDLQNEATAITLEFDLVGLENPFTDTDLDSVIRAYHLEIVQGVSATQFNPDGAITREQAATMLQRAHSVLSPIVSLIGTVIEFEDAGQISVWAEEGVFFAVAQDIMRGTHQEGQPPMFSPAGTYTREMAIVTVLRLFDLVNGIVGEVEENEEDADDADEEDEEETDEEDEEDEENGDDE